MNYLRSMRDTLRENGLAAGARPVVVHFDVPAEVCIGRWQANPLSGECYDVRDEDFWNVVEHFEPPGPDEQPLRVTELGNVGSWLNEVLRSRLDVST